MKERTEACKQCGAWDFYYKGNFSYCRPCHNEACKRYNKKVSEKESKPVPTRDLDFLFSPTGKRSSHERAKKACPQGHPYSGDNLYTQSQKNGKNVNRKCRACERNRKRVVYGLEPEPAPAKLSDLLDTD